MHVPPLPPNSYRVRGGERVIIIETGAAGLILIYFFSIL